MSMYHDGCQLTMTEIAAVMSLAGKHRLLGFSTEEANSLTAEKMWSACCKLMDDGMMTRIDGKFRLSRELMDVMYPICHARCVLVLTPKNDAVPQMICYCAETVTVMKQTPFGYVVLRTVDASDLGAVMYEHLDLADPELMPREIDPEGELQVFADSATDVLLSDAMFVIEMLDTEVNRGGWLRVVEVGVHRWLQWSKFEQVSCCILTEDRLSDVMKRLL